MNLRIFLHTLTLAVLVACGTNKEKEGADGKSEEAQKLVQKIEGIHNKKLFASHDAIQFDLNLVFKGKQKFNGRVYMTTDGQQIQAKGEKKEMYWNGKKAVMLPDTTENLKVRSALLTWTYFFAAPYKLSDDGVNHQFLGSKTLGGSSYLANKMTFEKNVGDSPDDWYILYKADNDLLVAMAYVATGGKKAKKKSELEPHAITYEAFTDVEGIPFATQWNFWTWDEEGNLDKLLGTASIGNIRFMKKEGDSFQPIQK